MDNATIVTSFVDSAGVEAKINVVPVEIKLTFWIIKAIVCLNVDPINIWIQLDLVFHAILLAKNVIQMDVCLAILELF